MQPSPSYDPKLQSHVDDLRALDRIELKVMFKRKKILQQIEEDLAIQRKLNQDKGEGHA